MKICTVPSSYNLTSARDLLPVTATSLHADNMRFFGIVALYSMSQFKAVHTPLGQCVSQLLECICTLVHVCMQTAFTFNLQIYEGV